MLIPSLIGALTLAGIALLTWGWRGRRVGDDPHCRRCGFNLRGRDERSDRCPECGGELSLPRAIRTGSRQRRTSAIVAGLLLAISGGGTLVWIGWGGAAAHNWAPWEPTAWLVQDLDAPNRTVRTNAWAELMARLARPSFPAAQVDFVTDRILARQGDRSADWNPQFALLLSTAAQAHRLDDARFQRYLRQSVRVKLVLKPKLRVGQKVSVSFDLQPDRGLNGNDRPWWRWKASPVVLGGRAICDVARLDPGPVDYSNGWSTTMPPEVLAAFAPGDYAATSTVTFRFTSVPGFPDLVPAPLEIPLSLAETVLPAGATVDEFRVDPAQRAAMRAALTRVRVVHDDRGRARVKVRTSNLPVRFAADVVLTRGGESIPMGQTVLRRNSITAEWVTVYDFRYPPERRPITGRYDVHFRPSQQAADEESQLETYWGEEIVFRDVEVDAPYAGEFTYDESLRPRVEAALGRPTLRRFTERSLPQTALTFSPSRLPISIGDRIFAVIDGAEVSVGRLQISTSDLPRAIEFNSRALDGVTGKVDLILRPDPEWPPPLFERQLPWGGVIEYRGVPVIDQTQHPPPPGPERVVPPGPLK